MLKFFKINECREQDTVGAFQWVNGWAYDVIFDKHKSVVRVSPTWASRLDKEELGSMGAPNIPDKIGVDGATTVICDGSLETLEDVGSAWKLVVFLLL